MKKVPIMVILSLILPALIGCSLWSGLTDSDGSLSPQAQNDQPDSTPEILEATVFSESTAIPLEPSPDAKESIQVDLIYCTTDDGIELTMDMYRPQVGKAPYPVVIYVHGGGWSSGDKSDGVGLIFKQELTRRGYIFVSINYRLAPKYSFPDPIEDVKCAVRHLRDHAAEYNLDPTRVGAIGGSAGGHLVALLGTTDAEAGWDVGQYSEQSSRVQAVVDLYGPADLLKMFSGSSRSLMLKTFNASNGDDPILSTYSPVTYVSADDPPFLIMHGDKDQVVSLEQSEILYERLKQAGVPVKLVVVKNAGHSFKPVEGEIDPNFPELFKMVGDFFDQYLK